MKILTTALITLLVFGGFTSMGQSAAAEDTPKLGVYLDELTDKTRQVLGFEGEGILVTGIVHASAAAEAGIEKDDILVVFNGDMIATTKDLVAAIKKTRPGQKVKAILFTKGKTRTLDVTMGPKQKDEVKVRKTPVEKESSRDYQSAQKRYQDLQKRYKRDYDKKVAAAKKKYEAAQKQSQEQYEAAQKQYREIYRRDAETYKKKMELARKAYEKQYEAAKKSQKDNADKWLVMQGGKRPAMGIHLMDVTRQLAEYFGVKEGALISSVTKNSPAGEAGLEAGDVITSWNGQPVNGSARLHTFLYQAKAGDKATLGVVRRGKKSEVEITLGEYQQLNPQAYFYDTSKDGVHGIDGTGEIEPHATNLFKAYDLSAGKADSSKKSIEMLRKELKKEMDGIRKEIRALRKELDGLKKP